MILKQLHTARKGPLHRAVQLFFVVLYILYAVSPLSYSLGDDADVSALTSRTDAGRSIPRVFVLEFLHDKLLSDQHLSDTEQGFSNRIDEDTVLARKRRAVVLTKKYLDRFERIGSTSPESIRDENIPFGTTSSIPGPFEDIDGYQYVNSGLSPPLA